MTSYAIHDGSQMTCLRRRLQAVYSCTAVRSEAKQADAKHLTPLASAPATSQITSSSLLIGCLLSTFLSVHSWAPTLAIVRWFILTSLPTHTESNREQQQKLLNFPISTHQNMLFPTRDAAEQASWHCPAITYWSNVKVLGPFLLQKTQIISSTLDGWFESLLLDGLGHMPSWDKITATLTWKP
jgi:hypothetical protein